MKDLFRKILYCFQKVELLSSVKFSAKMVTKPVLANQKLP